MTFRKRNRLNRALDLSSSFISMATTMTMRLSKNELIKSKNSPNNFDVFEFSHHCALFDEKFIDKSKNIKTVFIFRHGKNNENTSLN